MGTKNKRRKGPKGNTQSAGAIQSPAIGRQSPVADGQSTVPVAQPPAPDTIRKGIYLSALIYIEGDQAPPENFNALAKAALEARLSGKRDPVYDALGMTLKKVEQVTDVDEEEAGVESVKRQKGAREEKPKEEKFEF